MIMFKNLKKKNSLLLNDPWVKPCLNLCLNNKIILLLNILKNHFINLSFIRLTMIKKKYRQEDRNNFGYFVNIII